MNIYTERSHLLALLAKHYQGVIYTPSDVEEGFGSALCLTIGGHQATWHIADDDLWLFASVPRAPVVFDGHTTEEKYEHIAAVIKSLHANGPAG